MPVIVAYYCLTSQPIVPQLSGWHHQQEVLHMERKGHEEGVSLFVL